MQGSVVSAGWAAAGPGSVGIQITFLVRFLVQLPAEVAEQTVWVVEQIVVVVEQIVEMIVQIVVV